MKLPIICSLDCPALLQTWLHLSMRWAVRDDLLKGTLVDSRDLGRGLSQRPQSTQEHIQVEQSAIDVALSEMSGG